MHVAIAYFPSLGAADVVEVAFASTRGSDLPLRLFVDSGFTGSSSFLLPPDIADLAMSPALTGHVFGAIQGAQLRVIVTCRIPPLSFQSTALAIVTDLGPLGLPAGAQGVAGLRFLRQFQRWGSENGADGAWRFFLET